MASETSKCRERLKKYCIGNGCDLGYGGDPIVPSAITVDLEEPYSHEGNHPLNLAGDARDLCWFQNQCLDYLFTSHLLEDFENTEEVIREWLRVLKSGGHLVIYCPDEQVYRAHCQTTGQIYNMNHKISDFSLVYLKGIVKKLSDIVEIVHEIPLIDGYCFDLVLRKKQCS